jgi:arylsulfatase
MNRKPNIILITTDQHRADSMGCYGHPCVQTPHLDQLAYEGIRFDNAYSDCPVCIPARTTMITGIQSHRYGMPQYNAAYRISRDRDKFLGSLITSAGYQTQLVGKTHWHTQPYFRGGFESLISVFQILKEQMLKSGRDHSSTGIGFNEITPDISSLPPELYTSNMVIDKCIDFIENRDIDQPFFLWASFKDPHPPLVIHEPYYSMYDEDDIPEPVLGDWCTGDECPAAHYEDQMLMKTHLMSKRQLRKARSVYYGMITNLDYQLGRLFGKIMSEGEWDNTLVIYTTDHGEFLGDHGCAKKSSFCEASARIPFIIRPPRSWGVEPGRVSTSLVELADILPTFCEAAGAGCPDDVTGKSLIGIVRGQQEKVRDFLHGNINSTHMYHNGRYKYIYYADDGKELLFDVSRDRNDLVSIKGDRLKEMREKLAEHLSGEGHEHVENGQLVNHNKQKPPAKQALARDGAALNPLASNTVLAKHILHIGEEGHYRRE